MVLEQCSVMIGFHRLEMVCSRIQTLSELDFVRGIET